MIIVKKNSDSFNDLINKDGVVLVDIYAPWCGPCKLIGPVLEKASNDLHIDLIKVNSDDNIDFSKEYQIYSVPTMLIFKKGKLLSRKEGYMSYNEVIDWIKNYL